MSLYVTDDKSTFVQVMACCRQQAMTRGSVDPCLCRHMASLSHNELIDILSISSGIGLVPSGNKVFDIRWHHEATMN